MNFSQILTQIFFPSHCVACKKSLKQGVVCQQCFAEIQLYDALFCGTCKARLPYGKRICHRTSPYILGAATSYRDTTLKNLVHDLKFRGVRDNATPLAELIARYLAKCDLPLGNFMIIPLPLSKQRERERGFNQAECIAREFIKYINLPIITGALARTKNTKPQTETTAVTERQSNIKGCFEVIQPGAVAGKKIILLDDVTTSGATFHEAALALKSAGAKTIIAIAAAKA